MTVLRKSFYIHWSAGRSPRVHEVNPGRDPSMSLGWDISLIVYSFPSVYFDLLFYKSFDIITSKDKFRNEKNLKFMNRMKVYD